MNPEPTGAGPAHAAGSKLSITLADAAVGIGAIIILLFSFARTVTYSGSNGDGLSLWSYGRPLGIFVIIATFLLLATAVIDTWWKRDEAKVGVNRHHIQVGIALFVLVDIFGLSMSGGGTVSIGWGGVLQLLGALIAAAGAVLNHFGQLQNTLSMPNVTAKPTSTYPATQYAPGQVPAQSVDPAAATTEIPHQDPPSAS